MDSRKARVDVPQLDTTLFPLLLCFFLLLQLSNPCPPKPVPLGQKCIIFPFSAPPLSPHPSPPQPTDCRCTQAHQGGPLRALQSPTRGGLPCSIAARPAIVFSLFFSGLADWSMLMTLMPPGTEIIMCRLCRRCHRRQSSVPSAPALRHPRLPSRSGSRENFTLGRQEIPIGQ